MTGKRLRHVRDNLYLLQREWRGHLTKTYYIKTTCSHCGRPAYVDASNYRRKPAAKRSCSRKCRYAMVSGPGNCKWSGGRKYKRGHVLVYAPTHPNAHQGFVMEHRLVVEKRLKRYLKSTEIVHHVDCDRQSNESRNLVVVTASEHFRAHGSLNKCVKRLMREGYLTFNKRTKTYEVSCTLL